MAVSMPRGRLFQCRTIATSQVSGGPTTRVHPSPAERSVKSGSSLSVHFALIVIAFGKARFFRCSGRSLTDFGLEHHLFSSPFPLPESASQITAKVTCPFAENRQLSVSLVCHAPNSMQPSSISVTYPTPMPVGLKGRHWLSCSSSLSLSTVAQFLVVTPRPALPSNAVAALLCSMPPAQCKYAA